MAADKLVAKLTELCKLGRWAEAKCLLLAVVDEYESDLHMLKSFCVTHPYRDKIDGWTLLHEIATEKMTYRNIYT